MVQLGDSFNPHPQRVGHHCKQDSLSDTIIIIRSLILSPVYNKANVDGSMIIFRRVKGMTTFKWVCLAPRVPVFGVKGSQKKTTIEHPPPNSKAGCIGPYMNPQSFGTFDFLQLEYIFSFSPTNGPIINPHVDKVFLKKDILGCC